GAPASSACAESFDVDDPVCNRFACERNPVARTRETNRRIPGPPAPARVTRSPRLTRKRSRQPTRSPDPGRLESNALTAGNRERPYAISAHKWGELDDRLVEQAVLEAPLGKVGGWPTFLLLAASFARAAQPRCLVDDRAGHPFGDRRRLARRCS